LLFNHPEVIFRLTDGLKFVNIHKVLVPRLLRYYTLDCLRSASSPGKLRQKVQAEDGLCYVF
jgi:hypothetical protein